MLAIDSYDGQPVTAMALRLAPLVFVRPGELRAAEWSEFDLANTEWRIPANRMKMGEQHIVPLARQAVAIPRELAPLARRGRYVFPSLLTRDRPMSNNTINTARRLGYAGNEQTGHGFRSMASTLLRAGISLDVIELQLAHSERNKVRAAYNKAQRLPERRKMMQAWADYLDALRERARSAQSAPGMAVRSDSDAMNQSSSRVLADRRLTIAGGLLRGTLRLLWHAVRLPVYVFLVILEPVVRFILGALALLGVLTAFFLKFYGVRTFPSPLCSACRWG